jgi:hypothetical protein
MNKKKLKTEDGSEFTVFYLNTEPKNEASPQTDHFHGVCGKAFEYDKDISGKLDKAWKYKIMKASEQFSHPFYDFDPDPDINFPSFGIPFEQKEKFMINDKIEKDEALTPRTGGVYLYSENMQMYEFVDEHMVNFLEERLPMYELKDVKNNAFYVKAEDVKLYYTTPSEASDFFKLKDK